MNALQNALINAGLAEAPEERKRKPREYKCRKCGSAMIQAEYTNTMACSNPKCSNFFIFDHLNTKA